ncbi:MAG: hypothetical protein LBJ69_02035 [Holosporales bacterium]|jgi:transposase|nr:hypothetical protein [Holosporales bacterium]
MHHRHDISNSLWNKIKDTLPGSKGHTGRPARDNRKFINAFLKMKEWRGAATRYCKKVDSFEAAELSHRR